jgi:hypothetical protein
MNKTRTVTVFYLLTSLLVGMEAVSGCGPGQLFGPTMTPTSTNTPIPTSTSTPSPTFTPTPTFTPSLTPTPTIIPEVGKPVSNDNWEITLISPLSRKRIYRGRIYYTANPGYIFIDLAVRVKNLQSGTNSLRSSDIVVIDGNKKRWDFIWLGRQSVTSDRVIDPFSISVEDFRPSDSIDIEGESYLRLIYVVSDASSNLGFHFKGIPQIPFTAEKK